MRALLTATLLVLTSCATAQQNQHDIFATGGLQPASRVPSSAKFSSPPESIFDDVRAYAGSHHYMGYDTVACMDSTNTKLKLGGSHHWGGTMELFMDYAGGRMDIGKFKKTSDDQGPVEAYGYAGMIFTMTAKGGAGNTTYFTGQLRDNGGRVAEELLCYMESSGLE